MNNRACLFPQASVNTKKSVFSIQLLLLMILSPAFMFGQSVAINTDGSPAHQSAMLDIQSSSKGFLSPRMTTLERTSIAGPALGLTVFDLTTFSYWIYRGDVNGGWAELQHQYQNYWSANGNNIYGNNPGNIGIGTNNPGTKLTINAADPTISFLVANSSKGFLQASANDIRLGVYNANNNGKLLFQTNGVDRMTITPDGKMEFGGSVYIGDASNFNSAHKLGVDGNTVVLGNLRVGSTPNPSGYRMAVDGKIICTELMVKLVANWPDYVFKSSYPLPSLDELQIYLARHNHLPGIPSAKELESSGLNIGDMQKLQMEKIEELTLYILQLKKKMNDLESKLEMALKNTKEQPKQHEK